MPLQVIGAGFGRTGTASLKAALETLGFGPSYHMFEFMEHPEHARYWELALEGKPVPWNELFRGYRATVDWPISRPTSAKKDSAVRTALAGSEK